MLPQQYCLRWKYHHSNLQTMFSQLLDRGCFCDVTLACEGQLIRAHRVVLCACSTFFDTVLTNYASERDPIIIMKDVTFADVKSLIEFMYKGEINVEHANLASLLKTADDLKIKGLAEVSWRDEDDVANGVSSGAPPPTLDNEFSIHSPQRTNDGYVVSGMSDMRGSPNTDIGRNASPPVHGQKHMVPMRMPTLTPIPTTSVSIATADQYLGPKRKRGRPPLDDAYDVFNVHKLSHYGSHMDSSQPYVDTARLHAAQHEDQQRLSNSAYQQHIHQQQRRQRQKQEQQQQLANDSDDADDNQTDPEWITSNLEVNVAECETAVTLAPAETESNGSPAEQQSENKLEPSEKELQPQSPAGEHDNKSTDTKAANEKNSQKSELRFNKKRSALEKAREQRQRESKEREREREKSEKQTDDREEARNSEHEDEHPTLLPQPIEDIESSVQQHKSASAAVTTTTTCATTSSSSTTSTELPSTSSQAKITTNSALHPHPHTHSHSHTHGHSHIPTAHAHAHTHYAKYATPPEGSGGNNAGGYVLNEHGMLMTHDYPSHAAAMASISSNGDHDFVDIKMEDYDAADLRLTSEEMSQWQDVIKMDEYLAKGRRPQFWEEPFTRRVLDAIKNKRLEMKKAARILGVSYGTLYGRYREVYGCLKHPYSSTVRPSQSNQLAAVQPRFDIVWPSPKRDSGLLPASLEMGKIRPKDLSELWARPQI